MLYASWRRTALKPDTGGYRLSIKQLISGDGRPPDAVFGNEAFRTALIGLSAANYETLFPGRHLGGTGMTRIRTLCSAADASGNASGSTSAAADQLTHPLATSRLSVADYQALIYSPPGKTYASGHRPGWKTPQTLPLKRRREVLP